MNRALILLCVLGFVLWANAIVDVYRWARDLVSPAPLDACSMPLPD